MLLIILYSTAGNAFQLPETFEPLPPSPSLNKTLIKPDPMAITICLDDPRLNEYATARPKNLDEIYEPVIVTRPPTNAYSGLIQMSDGEIRHYAFGRNDDTPDIGYISSKDNGITWQEKSCHWWQKGMDFQSPKSGEYIRFHSERVTGEGQYCIRTSGGLDSGCSIKKLFPVFMQACRSIYIPQKHRILMACSRDGKDPNARGTIAFRSDDDGLTWQHSDWINVPDFSISGIHKSSRWQQHGLEPTMLQLKDGRIWMILRTSHDNFFETFSKDFGKTWEKPTESRFFGTNTMPHFLRLKDGKILFFWCNSTPLPEIPQFRSEDKNGFVFTNRDVLHVAISDDEGKTFKGFRELLLNARRNDGDYAITGGIDRSVHQSQAIQITDDKVLISIGQHPIHRVMVIFDVDWIGETERNCTFTDGLKSLCVHKYLKGVKGHRSFNRTSGAGLIASPDQPDKRVLQIKKPKNSELIVENDGATWNFPAAISGELEIRIYLTKEFKGSRLSMIDRWFNPVDLTAYKYAMFNLDITSDGSINAENLLVKEQWHNLKLVWKNTNDSDTAQCRLYIDGKQINQMLKLNRKTINGISYLHIISTAPDGVYDDSGMLIESINAKIE